MDIYGVGRSDQHQSQLLFANAAEANPAVQILVCYDTHGAADVGEPSARAVQSAVRPSFRYLLKPHSFAI